MAGVHASFPILTGISPVPRTTQHEKRKNRRKEKPQSSSKIVREEQQRKFPPLQMAKAKKEDKKMRSRLTRRDTVSWRGQAAKQPHTKTARRVTETDAGDEERPPCVNVHSSSPSVVEMGTSIWSVVRA